MSPMRNELESARKYRGLGRFATSLAVTAIGVCGVTAGVIDQTSLKTSINREVDNKYPHVVSVDELWGAKREILLFDREMHDLISRGELGIDSRLLDPQNLQNVRQSIALINQEADKQELELRLEKENHVLAHSIIDSILISAGIVIPVTHWLGFFRNPICKDNGKEKTDKEGNYL